MALSSTGLSHTYHLAPFVSDVITLSRPCIPHLVVFPKRLRSRSSAFHLVCYPLSTLISLNHHFYADDTKLFFSFYQPTFDSSITPRTKCPSANLFLDDCQSPNSQFLQDWVLLIGLKINMTRYTTPHLIPATLRCNLGFIFDEYLAFSDQISVIFKACYYRQFWRRKGASPEYARTRPTAIYSKQLSREQHLLGEDANWGVGLLDGVHIVARLRTRLNRPCAAVTRPYMNHLSRGSMLK